MKFSNIREMEENLRKITSVTDLNNDITFTTQGKVVTVNFINLGKSAVSSEAFYMGSETADKVRVEYKGEGNNITVTNVKVSMS